MHSSRILALVASLALSLVSSAQVTRVLDQELLGGRTLDEPTGTALDAHGNLLVISVESRKVFRVSPTGTVTTMFEAGPNHANDWADELLPDASGGFYLPTNDDLLHVDASGVVSVLLAGPEVDGEPLEVEDRWLLDANGDLVVLDVGRNFDGSWERLVRVTPTGTASVLPGLPSPDVSFAADLAIDAAGNLFVVGYESLVRVAPGGAVTRLLDATGDGLGNPFSGGVRVETDAAGDVYALGANSRNVLRVTPGGAIVEVLGPEGDGLGNTLERVWDLEVGASGTVFVADDGNVFRVGSGGTPAVLYAFGDPWELLYHYPTELFVLADGRVVSTGSGTDNLVVLPPAGPATEILGKAIDGSHTILREPRVVLVEPAGDLLVCGRQSDNVLRLRTDGTTELLLDERGDGIANRLFHPMGLGRDAGGNVYVAGELSRNLFRIAPDGTVQELLDETGDGTGNELGRPLALAVGPAGDVYLSTRSDPIPTTSGPYDRSTRLFHVAPGGTVSLLHEVVDQLHADHLTALVCDAAGNAFACSPSADEVLRFPNPASGQPTEVVLDANGDGQGAGMSRPVALGLDANGDLLVRASGHMLRRTPGGAVSVVPGGDAVTGQDAIVADPDGNLFLCGRSVFAAYQLTPGGVATTLIDVFGDGLGNTLNYPTSIGVDDEGNVFVAGSGTDNVFRIAPHAWSHDRPFGSNANSHTSSPPSLGEPWEYEVDLALTGHATTLVVGRPHAASIGLANGQTILIDGPKLFQSAPLSAPLAQGSLLVPLDTALVGLRFSSQAVHFGGPPFVLSNALDHRIGY